jgi:hypothetical protein
MSPDERRAATRLVLLGTDAIEGLAGELDNEDRRISDTAAYALGRYGPAAAPAVPGLIRLLGRKSGWAAHALARSEVPDGLAALREAFLGPMPEAFAALALGGKAGQRTLLEGMRQRTSVTTSIDLLLFVPLVRADMSALAVGLADLARDRRHRPNRRIDACSMLLQLDGAALPFIGSLGEAALDKNADVAERCARAREWLVALPERGRTPIADGPPIPAVGPKLSPAMTKSAAHDVVSRVRSLVGRNHFGSRIARLDTEVAMARVSRVASIGMSTLGPVALSSSLDWPDEAPSRHPRNVVEVVYELDSRQHVDIGRPDLDFDGAMAALARIGAELFDVGGVEAVLFTAGITYDEVLYPVVTVYVPKEASARFNWHFLDPGGLSQRLPPENVGVATANLKGAWISASGPPMWLE